MMRVRCIVEYDGTDFAGWQAQRRSRTVQTVLEAAVREVTGASTRVTGAGRTDAGVHARGQVAHFDTEWRRDARLLGTALNAVLPPDVAVREVRAAPAAFHARRSARSRTYRYTVVGSAARRPLCRRTALVVPRVPDVSRMALAAGLLLGRHDFGGFGRALRPDASTVRELRELSIRVTPTVVTVQFEADAFLRHQVRRMMGLLLDIGRGKLEPDAVEAVLARRESAPVARRVPACGLTLWSVRYPADDELWLGGSVDVEAGTGEDTYAQDD